MSPAGNWTIPNLITVARMILVPVFVMMFITEQFGIALALFLVAGLSDALDGYLARRLNQGSRLGAMLDPIADKLLLVTAYACLGIVGLIANWLAVLVIAREFVILGGIGLLQLNGVDVRNRVRPTVLGKLNTCGQVLLVVVVLSAYSLAMPLAGLVQFLVIAVAVVSILSGMHYVFIGVGYYRQKHF
ncbi:CDP-diacylglycerol--glycerol-3-phosphate 3-phosphatidyltransferase [Desulfonatronum thiosulfatophilum]|uniref:CDP-diacylglycerol--glycerol-3-phosphate 3-phosphatidyltransferase n=1 Tax=Desulfonatronum thiosulfatophilum TaxID=617002 RepID=A0A1G6AIZ3_9BACT|nr:CDP-diacylglycerol--glycerol-3-phosphate 3-phosphatidyltransferase [Desulfonatronum thiosulfatophilum]SDB08310.1 CDP-diacylglycerol--glycerol-3-phosphate 3-phosphatidyltransferase [Desulfonatronum thiosulfatophilum]